MRDPFKGIILPPPGIRQSWAIAEAITEFNKAIGIDNLPNKYLSEALVNRGRAYHDQGNLKEALVDFNLVIKLSEPAPEALALALLGTVHLESLDTAEKCKRLTKAYSLVKGTQSIELLEKLESELKKYGCQ